MTVSLQPLTPELHGPALQRVYELTPSYWALYGLPALPQDQARRDLEAAEKEVNRYALGILLAKEPGNPAAGAQLVGLVDFRLNWPSEKLAYLGMLLVAEPFQRQGIGTEAWRLLEPWLAETARMERVRLGVEQFNPGALRFFQSLDFQLTGKTLRIRSGNKFVRLLLMEKALPREPSTSPSPAPEETD